MKILRLAATASIACAMAVQVVAQTADGDYNFVDLRLRQGGPATSIIGSLTIAGTGASYTAKRALGASAAQPATGPLSWTAGDEFSSTLAGMAGADSNLRVRLGQGGVLVGAGTGGDHELMVALRKATAGPTLAGSYSGVYLRFQDGMAASAETSHVVFNATGTAISTLSMVSHGAASDDVNRATTQAGGAIAITADGTGSVQFPADGTIKGTMRVAASGDGAALIGTSVDGHTRDLLIVVRDLGDASDDAFKGNYWIAELGGESPYAQQPGGLQLSSADGSLSTAGGGKALLAERVRIAGKTLELSTVSRYRLGSQGARVLGRELAPNVRNLAFADTLGLFVSSWTGQAGTLMLEQGLMVGVRTPPLRAAPQKVPSPPAPAPLAAGVPMTAGAPVSAGGPVMAAAPQPALVSAYGAEVATAIAALTNPAADTQSPGVFSLNPGANSAVVAHADNKLVSEANPARPNEAVVVFLAQKVADSGLQVLFNGVAAQVASSSVTQADTGLYQINVKVPDDKTVSGTVALGVRTSAAFNDVTDISVRR